MKMKRTPEKGKTKEKRRRRSKNLSTNTAINPEPNSALVFREGGLPPKGEKAEEERKKK